MNIKDAKTLLKSAYKIKRPTMWLSFPGVGKSSGILQCCDELSVEYETSFGMIEIRGASSSPAELAAIKYVGEGEVLEAEQAWFPTNEKVEAGICPERGIIFCDEISDSMPAVVSTLQRMFLDYKLGGLTLADGWYVVAAGNRAKDKAATAGRLSRAFINRCICITIDADPDLLYDWGLANGMDYRTLAYLRFIPDCIQDGAEARRDANVAFCSPRSLEIASDLTKVMQDLPENVFNEAITGSIGDGQGSKYTGFLSIMNDLPDLDMIMNDPKKYPVPEKVDVAWATIGALINRATKKNVKSIMQYFVRFGTELSVVAIKDLSKNEKAVFHTKEFVAWSSDTIKFAV